MHARTHARTHAHTHTHTHTHILWYSTGVLISTGNLPVSVIEEDESYATTTTTTTTTKVTRNVIFFRNMQISLTTAISNIILQLTATGVLGLPGAPAA